MSVMVSESAESTQAKNASISVYVVVAVVVTLIVIAVLLFVFRRRRIARYRNKETSVQLALLPKQNIGSASAWSYFYGFLRLVLPDFKKRLIDETLRNDPDLLPKTVQKMLVIMPDSCICKKTLEVPTKIEFIREFVLTFANRAGNQQREYKSSLYKLIGHEKNDEYYFVGEFATPLLTMFETCTSALCGMTKDQLYVERDAFDSTLRAILSQPDNTKCNDQFKLLKWSDQGTKKQYQPDIYNFLLLELREQIKSQQKVTGENASDITYEDERTPLKEPPEPNVQLHVPVLPKQAIGRSSALGYFYGYLRLVLPDFKKRLIKKTNDRDLVSHDPDIVSKTVQKMLIIMPDSCFCASSLAVPNKIESTGKFVLTLANRAGNQQREYKSFLYKLIDHEKHENYYFVGELATPLMTMYETYTSGLVTEEQQLYDERDAFYITLKAILNHHNNAKCKNQYKLLNWSDQKTQKPDQPDIYNFLLLELREEIKSQQQKKKKPFNTGTDNNVPRSLNTFQPLPIDGQNLAQKNENNSSNIGTDDNVPQSLNTVELSPFDSHNTAHC